MKLWLFQVRSNEMSEMYAKELSKNGVRIVKLAKHNWFHYQ